MLTHMYFRPKDAFRQDPYLHAGGIATRRLAIASICAGPCGRLRRAFGTSPPKQSFFGACRPAPGNKQLILLDALLSAATNARRSRFVSAVMEYGIEPRPIRFVAAPL